MLILGVDLCTSGAEMRTDGTNTTAIRKASSAAKPAHSVYLPRNRGCCPSRLPSFDTLFLPNPSMRRWGSWLTWNMPIGIGYWKLLCGCRGRPEWHCRALNLRAREPIPRFLWGGGSLSRLPVPVPPIAYTLSYIKYRT